MVNNSKTSKLTYIFDCSFDSFINPLSIWTSDLKKVIYFETEKRTPIKRLLNPEIITAQ